MRILLDTHVFLWCIHGDAQLSDRAQEEFLNPDNELYFSAASYWEICIKLFVGKLKLRKNWEKTFDRELTRNAIKWLDLHKSHMLKTIVLPWIHRDPFDRLLVAQAICEKLAILTSDNILTQYRLKTIW